MSIKIDLHTHTCASDGIYSPTELIDIAISKNVAAMAITDHDSINGLREGLEYAKSVNFNLIPGIEFSVAFEMGSFHLLGLYVDFKEHDLVKVTEKLQKLRDKRMEMIVDDLNKNDIPITLEEIQREAKTSAVGRPHVARVLIRKGHATDMTNAFQNFLVKGKPGFVTKDKISVESAINIIKNSNGLAVIAHPISLKFPTYGQYDNLLQNLVKMGLDGIEVYSTMHNPEDIAQFNKFARKYNLVITGGSDFHGDNHAELGFYDDEHEIPVDLLKQLNRYKN